MNERCDSCGNRFSKDEMYQVDNRLFCEKCAINTGLYPLGHTGLYRSKISEKKRRLTIVVDRDEE